MSLHLQTAASWLPLPPLHMPRATAEQSARPYADLAPAAQVEHRRLYEMRLRAKLDTMDTTRRSQFLSEEKHGVLRALLLRKDELLGQGMSMTDIRGMEGMGQIYAWQLKYEVLALAEGAEGVLVLKPQADDPTALDQRRIVSHSGRSFDDILKVHIDGGHCKAIALHKAGARRFGASIPHWAMDLVAQTCPICVEVITPPRDCCCFGAAACSSSQLCNPPSQVFSPRPASPSPLPPCVGADTTTWPSLVARLSFSLFLSMHQAITGKASSAGHHPIITEGFGARGQAEPLHHY